MNTSFLIRSLVLLPSFLLLSTLSWGVEYLSRLDSITQFEPLQRLERPNGMRSLPNVMFAWDRKESRTYFINSRQYRFHIDFLRAHYLTTESGKAFYQRQYLSDQRRWVLGVVAWQEGLSRYTFELWEGDNADAGLIEAAYQALQASFFAPLAFKANSAGQESVASGIPGLSLIRLSELAPQLSFQPIVKGDAIGRLRFSEGSLDENFRPEDILVLANVPVTLPPVSGVIVTRQSSPLSHLNMLTRMWKVPNAYSADAGRRFAHLDGQWVRLSVSADGITVEPATPEAAAKKQAPLQRRSNLQIPVADRKTAILPDLGDRRCRDAHLVGAKAANLAVLYQAHLPGITVPAGFIVPFYYYDQFARAFGMEGRVRALLGDPAVRHDPALRQARLDELRRDIEEAPFPDMAAQEILQRYREYFNGTSVFARSSTNAEDLPRFNGAGLYSSVPNVTDEVSLLAAIKVVWGSIWNRQAFEAREAAGIDHLAVYPAVLVLAGINADSAGVMITTDPFRADKARESVYINAKSGLGMKVVDGHKAPEQIVFHSRSNAWQVLGRSDEDSRLVFDGRRGVREVPAEPGRAILNDAQVRRLAKAAIGIKHLFHQRHQDIEWAFRNDRLYIVQTRPYLGQD